MTFSKLNGAIADTFKTVLACAVVSIIGLVVGGAIGVLPAFVATDGEPILVCAGIGWLIAMAVFVHHLDKA